MRRTLATLSWIVLALVTSDRVLSLVEHTERQASSRLRRLVPPSLLEGKPIAAIRVEDSRRGDVVLVARTPTGWRSLTQWRAPADEARLESAVGRMLQANGIARVATPDERSAYGLNPQRMLRVSFHGPRVIEAADRDLIAVVEIGDRLPGEQGTYARLGTSTEVITVEDDLRQDLVPLDGGIPLLEPRIVPASWSRGASIERVEVRPEGASPFELRRRARNVKQEDIVAGRPPWEWVLVTAGTARITVTDSVDAFVAFLQQVRHRAPIDPRPLRALGLDPPRARVVLHPEKGTPLELQIGGAVLGGIVVRNSLTQSVFAVDPQSVALLVPTAAQLQRRERPSIWEATLRAGMPVRESPEGTSSPVR